MAHSTLHLSVLDQNSPRVYVQVLHIFPFSATAQREDAALALENGLQATLAKFPFLTGTVGPADPETGKLLLTYPTAVPNVRTTRLFASSKILASEAFPYTYEHLKSEGMPQSAFTREIFCPRVLVGHPGGPEYAEGVLECKRAVPALAVEAPFISGGLVLSMYFHHSVCDGSGNNEFGRRFAASVYSQQPGRSPSNDSLHTLIYH